MVANVRRPCLLVLILLVMLSGTACEDTTPTPEEQAAVETAVRGYLDALAESYSTLNVGPLVGYASPNEIATVKKLLTTLARSTNDRVDSELIGFEVEAMSIFRQVNATVRLIEVWDVTRYELTTGRVKGRNPTSLQTSILQLRRIEGAWIVIGRTVTVQEIEEQPTPVEIVEEDGDG
ncbi:MAG: hypothetical protein ACC742_09545 [Thermoanaerobaculales bacterium]